MQERLPGFFSLDFSFLFSLPGSSSTYAVTHTHSSVSGLSVLTSAGHASFLSVLLASFFLSVCLTLSFDRDKTFLWICSNVRGKSDMPTAGLGGTAMHSYWLLHSDSPSSSAVGQAFSGKGNKQKPCFLRGVTSAQGRPRLSPGGRWPCGKLAQYTQVLAFLSIKTRPWTSRSDRRTLSGTASHS